MTLAFALPPTPDSPLRTLDPRWKLAATGLLLVATVLVQSLAALAVCLALSLGLAALAHLPRRWFLLRLAALAWSVALFAVPLAVLVPSATAWWSWGPLTLSADGLLQSARLVLRALAILVLALVLLASTPLDALLKAARALAVPGLLVQLVLLSVRYLVVVADEFIRLRIALRVRGFRNRANPHAWRTIASVTGALLVRSHDRAERVSAAMRCRGFDGTFRCLDDFHTRTRDVAVFLSALAWSVGLVLIDLWGR